MSPWHYLGHAFSQHILQPWAFYEVLPAGMMTARRCWYSRGLRHAPGESCDAYLWC